MGDADELEEIENAESEDESFDRLGREQIVDGMKVVHSHTGDYSGLKSKTTDLFSFNRMERIRWKDVIYGGMNLFLFSQ